MNGIIFDCKRFAVHDGAGLRSTLFLKGCPLRCPWCQNPEGIDPKPALWHSPQTCVRCGGCVNTCPEGALTLGERIHVDRTRCTLCGRCVDACPAAAMSVQGRSISAQEAAELLLRDRVFFGESGGVTLSGGEVLMQWQFAAQVLALCKNAGVHTAVESCLLAPPQAIEALRSGLVDIAVVTTPLTPEDGLSIHALRSVRERAVCAGFPELCGRPVAPEELLRYPIVSLGTQSTSYQLYAGFFATHGLRFFPDIEAATADQILPLVEAGLGIGFVTEDFLQNAPGLHVLELTSPLPAREICAVKRTGQPLSLAAQEMEKMLLRDEPQETSKTGGK